MACSSSRKMKWIENTPDSGCAVDAFAVDRKTKSMSPVCTFCRVCASVPSWAPGYLLMESVPLLSSISFLLNISAPDVVAAAFRLIVGEGKLAVLGERRAGRHCERCAKHEAAQQLSYA